MTDRVGSLPWRTEPYGVEGDSWPDGGTDELVLVDANGTILGSIYDPAVATYIVHVVNRMQSDQDDLREAQALLDSLELDTT